MRGYDLVLDFVREIRTSEEKLVRWYYHSVLSTAASKKRRSGEKGMFHDNVVFFPKLRVVEKYLREGLEGFFDNVEIREMGMSRDGFIEYVERLERETRSYNERESILEL